MLNALSADRMRAAERIDEIARILAAGLMRVHAQKSRPLSSQNGESCFDLSPHQRGHAETSANGEA